MTADLEGHELVVPVFLAANGQNPSDDHEWLRDLWVSCADTFIQEKLDPSRLSAEAPADVLTRRVAGQHQLVLHRLRDVFCLSLLSAPAPDTGWFDLAHKWSSLLQPPTSGLLGTVTILQARLADPDAVLDLAELGPVVRASSGWQGRWGAGLLRLEPPLGPFAVWEVLGEGKLSEQDGRIDRRVVVVAPHANDPQLSAWTWSRGVKELTPFPRYLLQAAKVRYELRLWERSRAASELRDELDRAIAPVLRITTAAAETGRDPDPDDLLVASARLVTVQARELGLVDRASRLRDLRRTVSDASANMASYGGGDQQGGLFADDAGTVAWFDRQLERDLTYLDAAIERASGVTGLADQLVSRGVAHRQERINLGLTGTVGALLLVLTAIQSFGYPVPIPKSAQPAVIAFLGAFALLTSMIAVRLAAPRHALPLLLACLAAGLLGAATAWATVAVIVAATGTSVTIGAVSAWSGLGGVIGLISAAAIVRFR